MFIVLIDRDWNDDCSTGLIVDVTLSFEKLNWIGTVDLELDVRILGVDFVESIDKGSIFVVDYSTNR